MSNIVSAEQMNSKEGKEHFAPACVREHSMGGQFLIRNIKHSNF